VRVRQASEPERASSQQLVVGGDESAGRVPHVHAAGCQPLQLAGAALDAVEPVSYVEPRECDVSPLEDRERPVRIDELRVETAGSRRGDERLVRRAAPMGDDGELHTENGAERPGVDGPLFGVVLVSDSLPRYGAAGAPLRAAAPFGTGSSR
jgi:hypothetical protein